MMTVTGKHGAALLALSLQLAGSSWAQSAVEGNSPTAATSDACLADAECVKRFEEARAFSQKGELEPALRTYMSAYELHPVPWLKLNIGRLQQRLGLIRLAIGSYQNILATNNASAEPELVEKARKYLEQAEQTLRTQEQSGAGQPPVDKTPKTAQSKKPPSGERRVPLAGILLGSGAVVSAAVGGAVLGLAITRYDRLAGPVEAGGCKPFCSEDAIATTQTPYYAGLAMLGLAGAAAIATAIALPLELRRSRRVTALSVGTSGSVLLIRGAF